MKKLPIFFLALIIFIINALLIYPYFFQNAPGWIESIEVSFITLGRWWAQNFPHIFWNPYWYAGFPMRFSYVPLIPISTAVLGSLINDFGRAYHIFVGTAYALVPVSLFFFIRYLTKNSLAAFIGALIFSLVPSQGNLFAHVRAAQGLFGAQNLPPWRMMVMVFYGEGPHTVAQVFLPLAGLFYIRALGTKKYLFALLTSAMVALAALSNPIGLWATGILLGSIFLAFLIWEGISVEKLKLTGVIAILAYLFASFWYTPGFIRSDLIAEGGGLFSGILRYFPWGVSLIIILFSLLIYILRRFVVSPQTASVIIWFALTMFIVLIFYEFGIEFAPQARRYIPEMDMGGAVIASILISKVSSYLSSKNKYFGHITGILAITLVLILTVKTWSSARWFAGASNDIKTGLVEKKINKYLKDQVKKGERVFVSANYTFWLNMETDIWQLRGGHWQASIHPWEPHAGYQITAGEDGQTSLYWLKVYAINWLLVNLDGSPVHYEDYAYPKKFERVISESFCVICPTEVIYKIPLVQGMAGPVSLAELSSINKPKNGADKEALAAYVSWIEKSRSKLNFERINNDEYEIEGNIIEGEGIRVAMSFDRGFKARDNQGRSLRIEKDPLGFLLIEPKEEGQVKIALSYGPTSDFYLGWLLFGGGIFGAFIIPRRNKWAG